MRIVTEDLWEVQHRPTLYAVTTNSALTFGGHLVMGTGAALEAVGRYPGIRAECGLLIEKSLSVYGFLVIRKVTSTPGFGIFQVKRFFGEPADPEIIKESARMLALYANDCPDVNIRLNYPGIGAGRLSREVVYPLIEGLPDNVTVCER